MFLAGFGAMHYGWYNLQRNSTINKALAATRDKELAKVLILYLNLFLNLFTDFEGTFLHSVYNTYTY